MRGSPMLRTLIVLDALLVTGLALARLTVKGPERQVLAPKEATVPDTGKRASFELILSGTAKEISLEGGGAAVVKTDTAEPVTGTLELSGDSPVISLHVIWSEKTPGHRFAKLRLEIPGRETLEHVFTAPGDIDDIWELQ